MPRYKLLVLLQRGFLYKALAILHLIEMLSDVPRLWSSWFKVIERSGTL